MEHGPEFPLVLQPRKDGRMEPANLADVLHHEGVNPDNRVTLALVVLRLGLGGSGFEVHVFPLQGQRLGTGGGTQEEGDSTYSHHMKDAIFMMPTPRVLANVVDQLDGIDMVDTYLKLTGIKLGYLLNFGEELMKQGITRTINGTL